MKRILLITCSMMLAFTLSAQIQNGAFENWTSTSFDNTNLPWFNSNIWAMETLGVPNVTQETLAQSGNYAIKLETMIQGVDTEFAYIANTQGDPMTGQGGVPYSATPVTIDGYYKCNLINNDTALILVMLKNGGAVLTQDMFIITGTQTSFTTFSFTLSVPAQTPDTVIIAAASSNAMNPLAIENGSWLILDSLWFGGPSQQPIPGGDFENWFNASWQDPTGWTSDNPMIDQSVAGDMAEQTTDAYKGNYALKVTTTWEAAQNWIASTVMNGWRGDTTWQEGGVPFANQVDTLIGWYKYNPIGQDTAFVVIDFFQGNTWGPPIWSQWKALPTSPTYNYFEIPFNAQAVPDTIRIMISSSSSPDPSNIGSELIIDEIQMKSNPLNTGIQAFSWKGLTKVYPNPGNGLFIIERAVDNGAEMDVKVLDSFGKVVKLTQFSGKRNILDLSDAASGIYLLQISNGNSTVTRKVVIE